MRILALAAAIASSGPLPAPGMFCPLGGEGYGPIFVGPGPRDIAIDGMECHDARLVQGKLRATCYTNSVTDHGGTYPLDLEVLPNGEMARFGVIFRRVPGPACATRTDAWCLSGFEPKIRTGDPHASPIPP